MVVHLLIYPMPVTSVNIPAPRCIFKSEWYVQSSKMTLTLKLLWWPPLVLLECLMSRNCSVLPGPFMSSFLLFSFHFRHIVCLSVTFLPHFLSLGLCIYNPLPGNFFPPFFFFFTGWPLSFSLSLKTQRSSWTFPSPRLAHILCYQPCGTHYHHLPPMWLKLLGQLRVSPVRL